MRKSIVWASAAFYCLLIGPAAQAQVFGQNLPWRSLPEAQAAMSAAANRNNQSIAAKIFCYCGCDQEHGHRSLLDCWRTGHVPECKTCQNEFVRVDQLRNQGESIAQIQNEIDSEFQHIYPYQQPSPILRRYISSKESEGAM